MASGSLEYQRVHGVLPHEIEPGRSVRNDWDKALVETWAERKARRALERGSPTSPAMRPQPGDFT
jgi:hypothetical protein